MTTTSIPTQALERRLGPLDAAAIIIANVIGGGILFRSPAVAASVPDASWFLLSWLAGGVLAFMGAMAYAELAALRPKAGGEYVYLREAYGGLAGFLTGWTSFVAGFSGAMAASAVFLITTLDRFVPGVANATPLIALPVPLTPILFSFSRHTLAASAVIAVAAVIHIRGVGPGRIASNILTTLKVTAFVVFIAFGLTAGTGNTTNLTQSAGPVHFTGWLFAFIPVMFTYSGWNAAAYVAEEIHEPGRNVPRALAFGTLAQQTLGDHVEHAALHACEIADWDDVQVKHVDEQVDRRHDRRSEQERTRHVAARIAYLLCHVRRGVPP